MSDSEDSALGSQELNELQTSVVPENTKNATEWGINVFKTWCAKRSLDIDLKTVSSDVLATNLRRFYAEVKTKKNKPMHPSSLTCVRASLHRHLTQSPINRRINIITDTEFVTANAMFESKQKLYRKTHNAKPKHKKCIEAGDMNKLAAYFRANISRADVNQEFTWFNLCYYFGRRGREGWRDVSKNTFEIQTDDENKRYVGYVLTETIKNNQDARPNSTDFSDQRMYEQPDLCPIRSFEAHLNNLNDECDAFFQKPSKSIKKTFVNQPLGKNPLGKMMEKLSRDANLSVVYTNHCVRATTVTNLHRGGVAPSRICALTQHQDEKSLAHYMDEPSAAEKRSHSAILSNAFVSTGSSSCTITNRNQTVNEGDEINTELTPFSIVNYGTININITK